MLADSWATSHVTLEDILSHRTGLPRHDLSYGGSQDTLKDVVRSLRHLPMTAEPRAEYQYCNLMFMTASYVTEVLEEKWLGDVLKERIWAPLGMTSTVSNLYIQVPVREFEYEYASTQILIKSPSLCRKVYADTFVLSS